MLKKIDEGYYLDQEGNFYSTWRVSGQRKYTPDGPMKRMNGSRTKKGYTLVNLGSKKRVYLHQLMLETFVGPRPLNHYACHKNDDPADNRLDNLYWGTPDDNANDRKKNGSHPEGHKNYLSKLTETDVKYIRKSRGTKNLKELAEMFGISVSNASQVWNRKTYRNVK